MKQFFLFVLLLVWMTAGAQSGDKDNKVAIFGGLESQFSNQTPRRIIGLGANLTVSSPNQMILAQLSWVQFRKIPSASARLMADIGQALWASKNRGVKKFAFWPSLQTGWMIQWTEPVFRGQFKSSNGPMVAAGCKIRANKNWFSLHGEIAGTDGHTPQGHFVGHRLAVRLTYTRRL